MIKEEREFFDVAAKPWRDVPQSKCAGLRERILSGDPATGNYSRILCFDPGTDTTPNGVLTHDFWEEVYIVEGSIVDLRLGREFRAGQYACRPPGMPHGPWKSPGGCTTFEVRYTKD
ncbi:MAG TPA: cupin [Candidatus Binatia bacterium]